MNPTDQARDWIIQHLSSTNNYPLLSTFYSSDPYFKNSNPHFEPKTTKLLTISTLKNKLEYTKYNNLIQLIEPNNIFTSYHTLYPLDILSNQQTINSMNKKESKDLSSWVARLFQSEIELKVQIILSTNYFRTNYIQHKKLNDQLLHENHYKNPSNYSAFTPSEPVTKFISNCANGMIYIRRIHQQLDYLGQQCTKPNINLNNSNDSTVKKINEFLKKHKFQLFKQKILKVFDVAQNQICAKGKDFLTRLAKADIPKIIHGDYTRTPSPFKTTPKRNIRSTQNDQQSPIESFTQIAQPQTSQTQQQLSPEVVLLPSKPTKYGLRTVVDVEIRGSWCSGTIIKRYNDGSIRIALHQEQMDSNGKYKYDTHIRKKAENLSDVIHCITEDGEYEIDDNPKLTIDMEGKKNEEFSSPMKQEQIRQQKEQLSQLSQQINENILPFNKVLENRNRNVNKSGDDTMRNLENELLSMDMDENDMDGKEKDNNEIIMEAMNTNITSQSSDITEPNLSNQLSPHSIKKKKDERMEQFKVSTSGKKRRSPSSKRRKRNRQEFEKKLEHQKDKNNMAEISENNNSPKRRKIIQTNNKKQKDEITVQPQRRQSQRLLARRNSNIGKNKKKKVQTTIGAKNKVMTVNRNRNVKESSESESGEEQQWSDDMSDNMRKLNERSKLDEVKNKRKKPKSKWTKEQENALKECYGKHDKARKLVKNYAIWDQIKRDSDYCHHWTNRTATSLRDKARALLELGKGK